MKRKVKGNNEEEMGVKIKKNVPIYRWVYIQIASIGIETSVVRYGDR